VLPVPLVAPGRAAVAQIRFPAVWVSARVTQIPVPAAWVPGPVVQGQDRVPLDRVPLDRVERDRVVRVICHEHSGQRICG
jgi:hypothetical protein